MGKKLAIQGHPTRGKEVIELLKMLGGNDSNAFRCINPNLIYYVLDYHTRWDYIGPEENDEYNIFTLEEFLEKFPFKVGDFVRIPEYESEVRICKMKWTSFSDIDYLVYRNDDEEWYTAYELLEYNDNPNKMNEIKPLFKAGDVVKLKGCPDKNNFWIVMDVVKDGYIFNDGKKYPFDEQHHYEKTNREVINIQPSKMKNVLAEFLEHIKTTPKEELEREFEEIKEWSNVGPTVEEFMTFCETVNKKPTYTYPTTYEECCEVLMGKTNFSEFTLVPIKYSNTTKFDNNVSPDAPYMEIFNNLYTIIICRDAYWKIAGEQMGLDKPWKPDWNEETDKFTISNKCNKIYLNNTAWYAEVLSFPTAEMRDAFYENFKNEIEQCKELL